MVPGGIGLIGANDPPMPDDGEGPLREKRVKPFAITTGTITNRDFAAFVEATGYLTEAEHIGWTFVFWSQVAADVGPTQGVVDIDWWRRVDGASWKHITGPNCEAVGALQDHPAVHISWNDARAYASWIGGRLPTEAEWEHAARGGLGDVRFPWGGNEPDDESYQPCNIWQGRFPDQNTGRDGYVTTAPAHAFEPNGYGLFNMVGNVWEWTSEPFKLRSQKKSARARQKAMVGHKLQKGGSFLCHKSYCYRYRIAARIGNTPDSATTHTGFRVVWDT